MDYYWNRLAEGGDEKTQICGWLKDKYGISWQIVPTALGEMLTDKDPAKSERVMEAVPFHEKDNHSRLREDVRR